MICIVVIVYGVAGVNDVEVYPLLYYCCVVIIRCGGVADNICVVDNVDVTVF